ncbi:MAG: helix-turn-helix domain-containing protein [Clostridia bacterium]|nr:helix-turn-helix domain-containing protein [Clostridia bacterium]
MQTENYFSCGGELLTKLVESALDGNLACLPKGYELSGYTKAFEDADLVETCLCLFNNDLNVSRTAGELYMHRNTLIYRIAKLKRLTGLDACKFSDAVTFIILYRSFCRERRGK